MPGAWEYAPPGVLVSILAGRDAVATRWAVAFRELRVPPNSEIHMLSGMPFDHARNVACEGTLKHGFQWLFFLDDDVIVPANTIETLISRGKDIISGLYYRRAEPIMPVALIDTRPKPTFISGFSDGEIVQADLVGAGCLLIHRRVLERMKKPWFEWRLDRDDIPEEERCSEDFAFCRNARNAGFKIFVDTSVKCLHAGYGKSEFGGRFSPLQVNA